MFTKLILKYLRQHEDFIIPIGGKPQKGALVFIVESKVIWREESIARKIRTILTRRWIINEDKIFENAKNTLIADIFGGKEDYGDKLFQLVIWHQSRKWDLSSLTEADLEKAQSISTTTALTRQRFIGLHYSLLNLHLGERSPTIAYLSFPMVVKIPVIAIRYYVDIEYYNTFNAIRKSKHSKADELISYIYEIAFIQQKIAIALHEFLRMADYARKNKKNAILINAEVDAIRELDAVIVNLKSSIEKIITLIGLTHEISRIDEKGRHQVKMSALKRGLPKMVTDAYYWELIEDFLNAENVEKITNLRTGLLHKRGLSSLQPHSYIGKASNENPFMEIFFQLHEQHSKNTVVFISALAILTDKLVSIDPPSSQEQLELMMFASEVFKDQAPWMSF